MDVTLFAGPFVLLVGLKLTAETFEEESENKIIIVNIIH